MADTYNSATGAKVPSSSLLVKNFEFTRPANTTAYTIGDSVAADTISISAATNASPAVLTSAAHGLATGDRATISGATGLTNINIDCVVTVLTADTFKISTEAGFLTGTFIAGNGTFGGTCILQKMFRLADVVAANGSEVAILALQLFALSATVTLGTFRIRFYNAPISAIIDNAANTLLYANRAKHVGYIDLTIQTTDGSGSDTSSVTAILAAPLPVVCDPARTDLFVTITALGAYVPASAETFRLVAKMKRDQPAKVSLA